MADNEQYNRGFWKIKYFSLRLCGNEKKTRQIFFDHIDAIGKIPISTQQILFGIESNDFSFELRMCDKVKDQKYEKSFIKDKARDKVFNHPKIVILC